MSTLKYTIIKDDKQYFKYCDILESLVFSTKRNAQTEDEIDLLTLLIEDYDQKAWSVPKLNPVKILLSLMEEHQLQAKDLAEILDISKGYVSDILHYKKGFSKDIIRKLSSYFKIRQEVFNRPYNLLQPLKLKVPQKKKTKVVA